MEGSLPGEGGGRRVAPINDPGHEPQAPGTSSRRHNIPYVMSGSPFLRVAADAALAADTMAMYNDGGGALRCTMSGNCRAPLCGSIR